MIVNEARVNTVDTLEIIEPTIGLTPEHTEQILRELSIRRRAEARAFDYYFMPKPAPYVPVDDDLIMNRTEPVIDIYSRNYVLRIDLHSGERVRITYDTLEEAEDALQVYSGDAEVERTVILRARPLVRQSADRTYKPRTYALDASGAIYTPAEEASLHDN